MIDQLLMRRELFQIIGRVFVSGSITNNSPNSEFFTLNSTHPKIVECEFAEVDLSNQLHERDAISPMGPAIKKDHVVDNNGFNDVFLKKNSKGADYSPLDTFPKISYGSSSCALKNLGHVVSISTMSSLKNISPSLSKIVLLQGFHFPGDGGGGLFIFSENKSLIDNGGTVIVTDKGAWVRQFDGPINVRWFGARPDCNYDSSVAFQAAIDTANSASTFRGGAVFVPEGNYKASVLLHTHQTIFGNLGMRNSTFISPPEGASHVIAIRADANNGSRQNCIIRNISFINPEDISGVSAINISSLNINYVNDGHIFENLYIEAFAVGIKVDQRLIACKFDMIEITSCIRGVDINTAIGGNNMNVWSQCRFENCRLEGFKQSGGNIVNSWHSVNVENCNLSQKNGIAAVHISDANQFVISSSYIENNGRLLRVDHDEIDKNSIAILFDGDICVMPTIANSWIVGSGICIKISAMKGLIGGEIKGCRFAPLESGWDFYCDSKNADKSHPPLIVSSNNYFSGQFQFKLDINSRIPVVFQQNSQPLFLKNELLPEKIDLRSTNKLVFYGDKHLFLKNDDFTNACPGMTLMVYNSGNVSIHISGNLMVSGVELLIQPGDGKQLMVLGYPKPGKFIIL